jgi:membrane protease YdiL (CAAX protease family)
MNASVGPLTSTAARATPSTSGRQKILALIGVLFALGFPSIPISRFFDEFANTRTLIGYELIWWAAVFALLTWVRFAEREPLSSIGFRRPRVKNVALGVATGIVSLAGLATILYVIFPALHINETQSIDQVMTMPLWWRWITVIRAAVGEEVLFRGFAIERLQRLTGSARLAGIISCVIFTILHVGYWGWGHILIAGFAGALLTILYIWRRNLWANILAHFIVDGAAFLA